MSRPSSLRLAALGFSPAARPLLNRLNQALSLQATHCPGDPVPETASGSALARPWLEEQWPQLDALLAIGACGLVTRLIAPLLSDKNADPAVLVLDPEGRYCLPLLGGHQAGGEALCRQVAALLGGEAVITGTGGSQGRLALDAFGSSWGWQRGHGAWSALVIQAGRSAVRLHQGEGLQLWQTLAASAALLSPASPDHPAELTIGVRQGEGCRWHPPCLWLGLGCERHTSLSVLERLVDQTLTRHGLAREAVAGVATVDRKGDEAALLALVEQRGWPLRLFSAAELATVAVPNPSAVVAKEMGTASVAEAAALLAAGLADRLEASDAGAAGTGAAGRLLVAKTVASRLQATAAPTDTAAGHDRGDHSERGAATLAVALASQQWAPQRGSLHLVGSGPGPLALLSPDARQALAQATVWLGYGLYLDLLEPLRRPDQLRIDGQLTAERERCRDALALARQGLTVALVSSGDSGIYGMAGLALELLLQWPALDRPAFQVHPGISALQLAAARAGAPLMHDFCTISLSDRLTPWAVIEQRLQAAAAGDFVVALYNPRSRGRDWQLERARELLLAGRPAETPVLIARQLGRVEEHCSLSTLGSFASSSVDMLTLVLVGNSTSRHLDGWIVTPRGYPGASLA